MTRFVWLKDHSQPIVNEDTIQEFRFCRVPFGIISTPFLLGATVEAHLDSYVSGTDIKVLGMTWNTANDTLAIQKSVKVKENTSVTK